MPLTSAVIQRLTKDIVQLNKSPIDGIKVQEVTDVSQITAIIEGPKDTPFENGHFVVRLHFGDEYPQKPPEGRFLTKIFHPNVSKVGEICVNALKKDWQPSYGLKHILLVIRCLLIAPNPASALNEEAGRLFQEDYSKYFAKAKMFTSIHAKHTPKEDSKEDSKENENQQNPNIVTKKVVKQKSATQSPAKKKVNKKRSLMRL